MPIEQYLPTWSVQAYAIVSAFVALGGTSLIVLVYRALTPQLKILVGSKHSEMVRIGDRLSTSIRAEVVAHWGSVHSCAVFVTRYERRWYGFWNDHAKGRHQLRWVTSAQQLEQDVHPGAPGHFVIAVAFKDDDDLRSGAPDDHPILQPGKYRLTLMAVAMASGERVRRATKTVVLDWYGGKAWNQVELEEVPNPTRRHI
jgi:hypothetical protein